MDVGKVTGTKFAGAQHFDAHLAAQFPDCARCVLCFCTSVLVTLPKLADRLAAQFAGQRSFKELFWTSSGTVDPFPCPKHLCMPCCVSALAFLTPSFRRQFLEFSIHLHHIQRAPVVCQDGNGAGPRGHVSRRGRRADGHAWWAAPGAQHRWSQSTGPGPPPAHAGHTALPGAHVPGQALLPSPAQATVMRRGCSRLCAHACPPTCSHPHHPGARGLPLRSATLAAGRRCAAGQRQLHSHGVPGPAGAVRPGCARSVSSLHSRLVWHCDPWVQLCR